MDIFLFSGGHFENLPRKQEQPNSVIVANCFAFLGVGPRNKIR